MKRTRVVLAMTILDCLLRASGVGQAQTPQATELPGRLFDIQKTWTIGGEGNWDYLTFDPNALKLYIAHGQVVQVVDVNEGKLAGQIAGFQDAHAIALDDNGQYGYVSDGPSDDVKVFDRETLEIVASIPTGKNPRAIVFEPASRLIFVICPDAMTSEPRTPRQNASGQRVYGATDPFVHSAVTIIDADTQKRLAELELPGKLGFAQADGKGTVYVNITDRSQIAYFNAQAFGVRLRELVGEAAANGTGHDAIVRNATGHDGTVPEGGKTTGPRNPIFTLDWSDNARETPAIPKALHSYGIPGCESPRGLAVDGNNQRLFVACSNMKMQVLNSGDGTVMTTLPIGAGTDSIGYDANRGLIYVSNGGGVGSLTIIRQHLTDSYAVIQELPTRARARTLAVNPVSGEVYLVTNVTGFDRTHNGGIGGLRTAELPDSFQVLVVNSLSN
jgi:YVTN family beta-propeller protein